GKPRTRPKRRTSPGQEGSDKNVDAKSGARAYRVQGPHQRPLLIPNRPRRELGGSEGALVIQRGADTVRGCHEVQKQHAQKTVQDSDCRSKSRLDALQGFAPPAHPTRPTSALP